MSHIFTWIKRRWIYLSPLLLALYPALFLFSENLNEYRENVLVLPIIISLVFAELIFIICKLIFRKTAIAVPISSVFIFVLLSYSRIYEPFQNAKLNLGVLSIPSKGTYAFFIVCIFVLVIFLVLKAKKHLVIVNKILTIIGIVLIAFTLFHIASFEIREGRLWRQEQSLTHDTNQKIKASKDSPDIYYFIFDRYGGEKALREQYGFDNTQILNYLKEKGFYVPTSSTTNYPKTFLSLASSLNFEYLDFLTQQTNGGESADESIVTPLIHNNKVVEFLKNRGYRYIHMGSWWEPTATNPNADKNYVIKKGGYWGSDEFTTGFINTTVIASILNRIYRNPINVSDDPKNNDHRRRLFYEFDTATSVIPKIPGPKFVFVHILGPHDPFVVGKDCEPIPETVVNTMRHQENYLNQVQCVNKKIEKLVDSILANSKNPPIIILQADEGPFPMNDPISSEQAWSEATATALREKFPIFNAYYLPGVDNKLLYDSITPVNTFRVVFNDYFGTDYPLLPDKNYIFQDEKNYYKFSEVTRFVR